MYIKSRLHVLYVYKITTMCTEERSPSILPWRMPTANGEPGTGSEKYVTDTCQAATHSF
jgi:hypothetical protein